MTRKTYATVGEARRLLARAARRPQCGHINNLPTPRAIAIIRGVLRGRPAAGPISDWLAEVVSLISCRHAGPCSYTGRAECRTCGCFLCRRPREK